MSVNPQRAAFEVLAVFGIQSCPRCGSTNLDWVIVFGKDDLGRPTKRNIRKCMICPWKAA